MADRTMERASVPINNIPAGYCQCGCGERTALAPCTDASRGLTKGTPFRFKREHVARGLAAARQALAARSGLPSWTLHPRFVDIGDETFGRLTTLEPCVRSGCWLCLCECGRTAEVSVRKLRSGQTRSCGCLRAEHLARGNVKHGHAKGGKMSPELVTYFGMMARCYNPAVERYPNYGGRGITVCAEWRGEGGFEAFLRHMGPKPSPAHSIERKETNGNYEPGNCVWATKLVQANNTRANRIITRGDRTMTLAQWARETGLTPGAIAGRLKAGWSVERALGTPAGPARG